MSVGVRVVTHIESSMRTHALSASCVAILWVLAGCSSSHNDPREIFGSEITVDKPEISVARQLEAGAYLVEAREKEIDLQLVVDAPGTHSEAEDEVPRHGVLNKVVSLKSPGELRVTLRSVDHRSKKGAAQLRIARFQRAVDAPPGEMELGFIAQATAGEIAAGHSPATAQQAADKLYEAASHFETAGAVAQRAQAQYTLANFLYLVRSDYAGAIRAADEAANGFDSVDDEAAVQDSATLRAASELELAAGMTAGSQRAEQRAMYDGADRRLQEAAEFFATHSLPVRAAYAVNMRGIRALYIGDYAAAEKHFSQAVEMSRAHKDIGQEAQSLANLALIHNNQGHIAQAAAEYQALLPMVEKDRQPYQYATAIGNYAFCLIALGDFDRALALHNEALAMYTAQGREAERANELGALGGLYMRLGDSTRALEILRVAAATQQRVGNRIGQASALRMAGNAAATLRRHDEALALFREAIEIEANRVNIAQTRVLIAGELRALGDLRGAEAELAQALESDNAMVRATSLAERGRIRNEQRNLKAAIADLREADRLFAELHLDFSRIPVITALSRALLLSGDAAGASAAADQAVAFTGRIRESSANPEWRARFLSSRYKPYEMRIAADFALGGPDAAWRGFRTSEVVRARSLADQIAVGNTRTADDAELEELRAKLTALQMRLEVRSRRQGANDATAIELRRAVEETSALIEARNVAVAALDSALPGTLRELQVSLPRDVAVLVYFVGDYQSHAWLLTRETFRHHQLPAIAALDKAVEEARRDQRGGAGPGKAINGLGALLLGNLLDGIGESRLLVIADGPLNGVPFAALPMGRNPGEMLLDRFVLGYAPSLSLAMKSQQARPAQHAQVAVISDPVYAPDDRRLRLASNGSTTLRGPDERPVSNFSRLAYSAMEARAVVKAMGNGQSIELAGFDATAARVLALRSNDLGVLHFATHAAARSDSPEQSALFLSEYSADGTPLPDSRLTVEEITRSGLHADVVVLSGCDTGSGSELRGEGVLGLVYGFLANGSHAVVASLWPIEDASTARFMNEFYGAYRAVGRPAQALRTAQLRTRDVAATAVWSSFVVRANGFP